MLNYTERVMGPTGTGKTSVHSFFFPATFNAEIYLIVYQPLERLRSHGGIRDGIMYRQRSNSGALRF